MLPRVLNLEDIHEQKGTMTMKDRIGFIGLGIMGKAMAANIARAGYPLTVYNRTPGQAADLQPLAVKEAATPGALAAEAEVIILMLTGPEAIDQVLWGEAGVAACARTGTTIINMSTVSPNYSRELQHKLAQCNMTLIDAPVSGSKKPAADGTLLILAGGDREHVAKHTPLLGVMGKKVIYCGPVGQGSMMKMAINLLLGAMMEALCETVNFGKKGGLAEDVIFDVITSGPLNCSLYQGKEGMLRNGDFAAQFPLKHAAKDLKFIVDTAYETGAAVPVGHALLQLFRLGVGQSWGDLDIAAILKVIEFMSGSSNEADKR